MQITREKLEARRKMLSEQFEKLSADRNATLGALQDCNYWIAQLDAPESQPTEEQK
jgi:hypothetical protein